jgi:hypothetical protein
MTAPATTTGEVVAPVTESATPTTAAPVAPEAESAFDLDTFAADLAKELTPGSNVRKQDNETEESAAVAKAVDEAIQSVVVDANGRPHDPATGKFLPADAAPKTEPPAVEAQPAAEVATETKPEAERPKAPFTVYANGQTTEPPPVEIEFQVNGKVVREPLDKVVRRAQSAGYNAKLEEEVAQAREIVPKVQTKLQELEAAVQAREEYLVKLLSDPQQYIAQQEAFAQAMTPEAQLERERAQRHELEQQLRVRESVNRLAQATESVILPRFQSLLEKYPHVTAEELHRTFTPLVRPLQSAAHGGAVPVEAVPQVVELIDTVLAGYAENLHEARAEAARVKAETEAREKAAQEAAERARIEAQQRAQKELATAKAGLARTIAPVGAAVSGGRQKPKDMTRDQAANWALEDALKSVGVA